MLPAQTEGNPAGGEDTKPGAGREQVPKGWGSPKQMLEIIKHEQDRAFTDHGCEVCAQRTIAGLWHPELASDGRKHEMGVSERGKIDKGQLSRELRRKRRGDGYHQPRLADACRTEKCEQPHRGLAPERPHRLYVLLVPEQRSRR